MPKESKTPEMSTMKVPVRIKKRLAELRSSEWTPYWAVVEMLLNEREKKP